MATFLESQLFTGPGWVPPTELSGSTQPRIGGGRQAVGGGVPVRNNYRGSDTSALTHDVWKQLVPSGMQSPSAAAAGSSSSSSSSSPAGYNSPSHVKGSKEFASPAQYDFNSTSFVCRAISECEPCPPVKRNHPFCRPYGNRRLVACRNMLDDGGRTENLPKPFRPLVASDPSSISKPVPPSEVEFQGWEACGKVVAKETKDYLEFVMILILMALAALMLLIKRNRYLTQKKAAAEMVNGSTGGRGAANSTRSRRARVG